MAKSPISALLTQENVNQQSENTKPDDIFMSLTFHLKHDKVSKFNLRDFCHIDCEPSNDLAIPSRYDFIRKIYNHFRNCELSEASKDNQIRSFKRYIKLCDRKNLNPFSRDGIEGILGMQGELARQEKLANEPMPFKFNYSDGDELGIKSSSANSYASAIKESLRIAGCSVSLIEKYARRPNVDADVSNVEPHTDNELNVILSRVQQYFFSLAKQISNYFDEYNKLPQRLDDISIGKFGFELGEQEILIDLGSRVDDTKNHNNLPFNQMMISAYILFCYYTSFNDTQIRDVRHPLTVVTQRREGRTEKYVKVKGYKGRKGSDVEAYFVGIEDGTLDDTEAKGNKSGFILADFLKRGNYKHTDGLVFINTFSELSRKCSSEKFGKLFYTVDSDGKLKKFDLDRLLNALTFRLGLLAEDRSGLSDYLNMVVCKYLDKGEWERISVKMDETGFRTISRKTTTDVMKSTRVHSLVYAFVRSLTDIPLKGALIPLSYRACEESGDIEVCIDYLDGSRRSFFTAKRYLQTLKRIETRAETFNPTKSGFRGREVTRPAYFLPMGVRSETYQWPGHEMPVKRKFLLELGIDHGAYLLSTGSSRIRAHNSHNFYTDADLGRQARDVMQHSKETQNKSYINGHPMLNMKQVSQGLEIIGHLADGDSLDNAKTKLKAKRKINVLAYDEWKLSKYPSNPNGVACNGKIDLIEGKNEHYAAQKFAKENGIIADGEDITCFQYDLCIFCKNMQLIDDAESVYKLVSFIDSLYDAIEKMPDRVESFQNRIDRYESLLELLPEKTLEKADALFEENGRYFLFK
ncbi:hypothetical protein BOJ00_RS01555 [Vibrio parahaemolyticus]|nr:hypothetical protein [Vibrio parahaemolyticus]